MKTNFSLLFYLKKQKNYESGEVPVYLRITINSKRAEIATGRQCDPKRWNAKSGRMLGSSVENSEPLITPIRKLRAGRFGWN